MLIKKLIGDLGNRLIDWTLDGYLAIVVDNQIQVYDIKKQQTISVINVAAAEGDEIQNMAWSPEGKWVAVGMQYSGDSLLLSTENGKGLNLDITLEDPFWLTVP